MKFLFRNRKEKQYEIPKHMFLGNRRIGSSIMMLDQIEK